MSSEIKRLEKPQLRYLLAGQVKFHLFGMIAFVSSCGLMYKALVKDPRKKKYEEFYKTYDMEASFKKMCKSGYMVSCGPDDY